jgi:hypothetical protein
MKGLLIILLILPNLVTCGPLTYAACQTACNKGAMSCYGSFSVIFGAGAVVTCSLAQGACMVGCTPLLAAPTP